METASELRNSKRRTINNWTKLLLRLEISFYFLTLTSFVSEINPYEIVQNSIYCDQ